MNARRIITIALSLFVTASIIYLVASELRSPAKSEKEESVISSPEDRNATDSALPKEGRSITVYYFHTTARCPTCLKIEALTASTVQKFFPAELAAQKITWKPINIELPENRHFVDDFKLFTKSVVVVDTEKGRQVRWKNLDKIWELVRNESAFTNYIKSEVSGYIKSI
jgi:hypothetical protein